MAGRVRVSNWVSQLPGSFEETKRIWKMLYKGMSVQILRKRGPRLQRRHDTVPDLLLVTLSRREDSEVGHLSVEAVILASGSEVRLRPDGHGL
jgi:hypothetical protein